MLAGFVLARAAAGLSDGTISSDVIHLEQVRAWFGRPLWDMEPADADGYFGKALRSTARGTRLSRAQALKTYVLYLELRHKAEIHQMTGRVVECPIDEMNRCCRPRCLHMVRRQSLLMKRQRSVSLNPRPAAPGAGACP